MHPMPFHWPQSDLYFIPVGVLLLLLVRRMPVVAATRRTFTFLAPVLFAILVSGAPLSCLLALIISSALEVQALHPNRKAIRRYFDEIMPAVMATLFGSAMSLVAGPPKASASLLDPAFYRPAFWSGSIFLASYAVFNLLRPIEPKSAPSNPNRRNRPEVAFHPILPDLLGFAAILLLLPLVPTWHLWTMVPFSVCLVVCGLLLRRIQEVARLRGQLSVSQTLRDVALEEISPSPEPAALLYRILELARSLVHYERAIIWLADSEHHQLNPIVGLPDMGEFSSYRPTIGHGLIGGSAERELPTWVSDVRVNNLRQEDEPGTGSWMLYPILLRGRIIGVAQFIRSANRPFTRIEATHLDTLIPQAGIALDNLHMRTTIQNIATTDDLTQLLNARTIKASIREEIRRAARYNRPLSILILDVDNFKSFNDTYGHPQGDLMLRHISRLLKENLRLVDKVGRYGGEEFVVLMPETHKDDAFRLAERIRAAIEAQGALFINDRWVYRTVSIGVASFPEDGLNSDEILQLADKALYRAKNSGKNRVVWAGEYEPIQER